MTKEQAETDGEANWGLWGLTPMEGRMTEGAAAWVAKADVEAGR